jgi:AraC-like DNA-binding protein
MAGFETVVHHRSELGEWESVGRGPHPALRGLVRQYSGWMERTVFTRRIEVPSPVTVLIIPFPQPLYVAAPREPATRRYDAFIGGLVDAFVVTEAPGGVGGGLQVNFTPIGAYRLLGMPQHLVANAVVDAVELMGNPMRRLIDRVMDLGTWEERIDAVEAFLLARLTNAPEATPGIEWAWRQLRASGGAAPIGELAEALDYRPRQFIDLFRQEVGLAPKTMARVLRFHRVIERLQVSSSVRWADLAAECGYYDQSHFVREFREFAGSTPTEFLGRKLPDGAGFLA